MVVRVCEGGGKGRRTAGGAERRGPAVPRRLGGPPVLARWLEHAVARRCVIVGAGGGGRGRVGEALAPCVGQLWFDPHA